MLGLESGTVRVVPADPRWPLLFVEEAERIREHLRRHDIELVLEHSGSTAVPGLPAKPIIDILGGRAADLPRHSVIAALEAAGYEYRGEQGIPGRDFFRRGTPRSYHLHLTEIGSDFWHDHRVFRDYLKSHPDRAAEYAALKLALAARFPRDREAYIDGKTDFVLETLTLTRRIPRVLHTERLLLRPWDAGDAEALAPILARNESRLLPWIPARVATAVPVPELAHRLAGFASDFAAAQDFRYAMLARADGRVLGEASLFPRNAAGRCPLGDADRMEIGYWIDASAEGHGLVTEAAEALLAAASGVHGVARVEIRCSAANTRSASVPRRLGFALDSEIGGDQVWIKAPNPSP